MSHIREFPFVTLSSVELWTIFHDELDLDGNGHLDSEELHTALSKAGAFSLRPCVSSSCSIKGVCVKAFNSRQSASRNS